MCVCVYPMGFGGSDWLCEVILKILESLFQKKKPLASSFQKYIHNSQLGVLKTLVPKC